MYPLPTPPPSSSVASFLVLAGGKTPKCTDKKIYVLILRERAKRASASETYIFRTQCTSAQLMQFPLITYGRLWRYKRHNYKTLTLRKKYMNMRASGASELNKISHFHSLKLLFPSIFCWYFRYFVSETFIFRSQITSAYIYIINAFSFYHLWYDVIYKR